MKQSRKARGWTQEQAARLIGVALRKYQRWESGYSIPRDHFNSVLTVFPEAKEQVLRELFPSIMASGAAGADGCAEAN